MEGTTQPDIDGTKVVAMLVPIRDSLTEVPLMRKDQKAHLDVSRNGALTRQSSEHLDVFIVDADKANNQF